ncbi:MAG: DUF4340 domain-containing protein [Thiohalomonadales bacterium]
MPALFQSKQTLNMLLFVVIVGLGLLAWLIPPEDADSKHAVRARISNLPAEQISSIEIRIKNKPETRLEKRAGRWFMIAPIHIEANDFLANRVTTLLNSEYSSTFALDKDPLAKFGLSPAWISVKLDKQQIDLGHSNRLTQQRYIWYQNAVFMIADNIPTLLNAAPSGFISTKILPSDSHIIAVEFEDYSIERQDERWLLRRKDASTNAILSQDLFVKFIDEWRLAQAIYVRLGKAGTTEKPMAALPIVVILADGQKIGFDIMDEDTGKQLLRPDLGIYYHIHKDTAQTLLNFPPNGE